MRQDSIWTTEEPKPYPTLRGRRSSDAVVIGGGLSGLSTALWLCKAGLRVSLLEAERIGHGASSSCAGIVSLAGGLRYARLEKERGNEIARSFATTQQGALSALRTLSAELKSDWQDADAQLVSDSESAAALEEESQAMNRAGVASSVVKPTQCPLPAKNALLLRDMGALDPIKHLRGLAEAGEKLGLNIYERSRVTAVETNLAYTERGSVLAPFVVIATGYPIINVPGWYFLKLTQRRGYLASLSGGASFDGMYQDVCGSYALRGYREGALLQMNGARVGESLTENGEAMFAERYALYMEGASVRQTNVGVETYSPDGLPYIGAYSRKTPNLFVASGYGGHGLIGSMVAAQAISAAILGLPTESYAPYSGNRPDASRDVKSTLAISGRYLRSQLRTRAPRCPHMGCKLRYRRSARIWECPCHGSRFDDIGHVLGAPAVHDAHIDRR